jgi:hypothetical protein
MGSGYVTWHGKMGKCRRVWNVWEIYEIHWREIYYVGVGVEKEKTRLEHPKTSPNTLVETAE